MTFYIEFENEAIGKIDPSRVDSFSFMAGLFNVYAGAKLFIKDFTKEHNNDIKTGMGVKVVFKEEDDSKSYEVLMAVLSFKKVPGPDTTDYVDITLVSKSYFYNSVDKVAYSGTTSKIIGDVFSKKIAPTGTYKGIVLQTSDDLERVRYQLSEKSIDFMDRISKYANIGARPMYLFSDAKGYLNFKGIDNMEKQTPRYVIEPLLFQQREQNSEASLTTEILTPTEMDIDGTNKSSISRYTSIFNTSNFVYNGEYASSIVTSDNEDGNASSEIVSPEKVEYYGWNLSPGDALGIAARKNYERMSSTYTIDVTFESLMIDEMDIGNTIYVMLPYDPTARSSNGSEVNAGEGKYMVTSVKFIYEENKLHTYARLLQIGY